MRYSQETETPLVSVILPIYNGSKFIEKAVISILNQTYINFELLLINDGSTDKSFEIIKKFTFDKRVRLYNKPNSGLSDTLNFGLKHSNGKYLIRMDQDDISFINRIEVQVKYLEKNNDVLAVGAWAKIIDKKDSIIGFHKHNVNYYDLCNDLKYKNPFVHSSMCLRKSLFIENNLKYNTNRDYSPPEDYDLWTKIALIGKIENLPLYLIYYRNHIDGMSKADNINKHSEIIIQNLSNISYIYLTSLNQKIDINTHRNFINFLYKKKIPNKNIFSSIMYFVKITNLNTLFINTPKIIKSVIYNLFLN
jgi:glycosyltransferase involved in cell wall biosynthesis